MVAARGRRRRQAPLPIAPRFRSLRGCVLYDSAKRSGRQGPPERIWSDEPAVQRVKMPPSFHVKHKHSTFLMRISSWLRILKLLLTNSGTANKECLVFLTEEI